MLALMIFVMFGVLLGTFTGLTPGIHVNTVLSILLLFLPTFIFHAGAVYSQSPLTLIAIFVVAMSIAHTFLDIIPSIYLGAPDEGTALAVLPTHRMMHKGLANDAIYHSALGSMLALIISVILLIPARAIMGTPINLYAKIRPYLGYVILSIALIMIAEEGLKAKRTCANEGHEIISVFAKNGKGKHCKILGNALKLVIFASMLFMLSGLLGVILLYMGFGGYATGFLPIGGSVLFPIFTGMFGFSSMLWSLITMAEIPEQIGDIKRLDKTSIIKGAIFGTLCGGMVGWLPGVSSGVATAIVGSAMSAGEKNGCGMAETRLKNDRLYILSLSGVNTSNTFFALVALFVILRGRTGAMVFVKELLDITPWYNISAPPQLFLYLLLAAIISGIISYPLTIIIGRKIAEVYTRVNYRRLTLCIIVAVSVLIFLFTGVWGMLIAAVSTAIGMLPPRLGVKRVHLMGVLMVPIILYFLG